MNSTLGQVNVQPEEIFKRICWCCGKKFDNLDNYIDKTDPLLFKKWGHIKEYHKTCWKKIEKENERIKQEVAKKQAEICAKFAEPSEELKKQMAEEEGEYFDPDDYTYQHEENPDLEIKDWDKFNKTKNQKKKNKKITELTIKPNEFEFKDNKLVINESQFPNLKKLHANNCGLTGAEIESETLTHLYLNGNLLSEIDLSKVPNLQVLWISNNILVDLEVTHLKNLRQLWCFSNKLEQLDCSDLTNLVDLNCSKNIYKKFTDEDGKTRYFGMEYLHLDGCSNIKYLDCDLNGLDDLDFSELTNLREVSLRQNNLVQVFWINEKGEEEKTCELYESEDNELILNSPFLKKVDYNLSNVKKFVNRGLVYDPKNVQNDFLNSLDDSDSFSCVSNETVEDEGYWSGSENGELKEQNKYQANDWEDRAFERQQAEEKEEMGLNDNKPVQAEQNENIITNPDELETNYKKLKQKSGHKKDLDLSHKHLTETIIFDGWQNLKELNVGNNPLSYLVIKNCPQLTKLRYAHCKLKHDAFIDWNSCPNLRPENVDNHNWDGHLEWGEWEENKEDGKEKFNQELEQGLENEKQEKLRDQLYQIIIEMLEKTEGYVGQGNQQNAERNLAEIKKALLKSNFSLSKEQSDEIMPRLIKLEQRLQTNQITAESVPTKLIVGLGLASLSLGIVFYLMNKWIKNVIFSKINNHEHNK